MSEFGQVNYESKIAAISYYLPETILTNEELSRQFPEWKVDQISAKTGITQRHISDPGTTAGDLAFRAAQKLFEEYSVTPDQIDFILFCTQSPDYFIPTTACILQQRLGIPESAGALDFNMGCSGFVYGLSLAKGLIASEEAGTVLLLTADTYSKYIHPADKSNRTLFGDGAAATLVSSRHPGAKIGRFVFGTDGNGAENLIIRTGASRTPERSGRLTTTENGTFVRHDDYLYMNGPEIFKFTAQRVPALVDSVLRRNRIQINEIDQFVFHQANRFMLDFVRNRMAIPSEKFVISMTNSGNTVSSTIPIALKPILDNPALQSQTLLLAGFGVGYSWGGCTLHL